MASSDADPLFSKLQLDIIEEAMKKLRSEKPRSIPSSAYSYDYYLSCCDGYEEFENSQGLMLPERLRILLELVEIHPGKRVLDIGCGRGEVTIHCALQGALVWGIDYSNASVQIATQAINKIPSGEIRRNIIIILGNAINLSLSKESIDTVFMFDVVEHLTPDELKFVFREVHRILEPGGSLFIHTMPNLWYYRVGYPIFRALQKFRGIHLPVDPRERWAHKNVHINEQTPRSLRHALKDSGFRAKVWLMSTQSYSQENNKYVKALMKLVTQLIPFRWFFCNEILAKAKKIT